MVCVPHVVFSGCCKTTLARAVSGSLHSNFIALLGTQLHSLYVGEGEATLREAFEQARLVAPSIIFIDEIDSIGGATADVSSRVALKELITEFHGCNGFIMCKVYCLLSRRSASRKKYEDFLSAFAERTCNLSAFEMAYGCAIWPQTDH